MRTEPVVSAVTWVAATWWLILSSLAGVFTLTEGSFSWDWAARSVAMFQSATIGLLIGVMVAVLLITHYRRTRMSVLAGEKTLTGRTTIGPYPGYWRLKSPTSVTLEQLVKNDKLKILDRIAKKKFLSAWLSLPSNTDDQALTAQVIHQAMSDDFKHAFFEVLCVYATRPALPATTRSGFHGGSVSPVTLIDHALSVADTALGLIPDFIYRGLVSRPKRMPVLPPRDSHYMPDTFKSECPVGLIALTALAHDVGKVFTFHEEADGRVTEARGKHGPVGARMIPRLPSIQRLHPQHIRTVTAVLAHYHACHTLPLDVDPKSGEMLIRDDKTVALMEIVIQADKAVCSAEAASSLSLSDYESDSVEFKDTDADLIWQSIYLAITPNQERKPINGGNHERLGFKNGEYVYLIEDALLRAVTEFIGNIQPPGDRGGVNTLTQAILHQLHKHSLLVTDYQGKSLDPGQALFKVEFRQPAKMVEKQGVRHPKLYKRMIIIPAYSDHLDFRALADSPMEPTIIAPSLGKHRGTEKPRDDESETQADPIADASVPPGISPLAETPKAEQAHAPVSKPRKPVSTSPKPASKQDASEFTPEHLEQLKERPKAKKRKHARPITEVSVPAPSTTPALQPADDLELPDFVAGKLDDDTVSHAHPEPSEGNVDLQIDAVLLRKQVPVVKQLLTEIHTSGNGPKIKLDEFNGVKSYMTRVSNMPEVYPMLPWASDSFQTLIKTTASPMSIHRNGAGHLILVVTA